MEQFELKKEQEQQPGERILNNIEKIQTDYIANRLKKEKSPKSDMGKKYEDADWQDKVEKAGKEVRELFESFDLSWLSEVQENFILGCFYERYSDNGKPIWRDGIENITTLLINIKNLSKLE